ncbi:MAG: HlyC/CorC family transporter, partial [Spirochaetales bacterium]|nr:HlyC/CorC family transporter [Spirochaetales bacterium]
GFSGVVTMEDVAEQLFGELFDEHESRFPDRVVEHTDKPGTFVVMADAPFQQVVDDLDLWYEGDRTSTVAAYLLQKAGSIPVVGEVIATDLGTWQILLMKGNKVEVVEFTPNPASVD